MNRLKVRTLVIGSGFSGRTVASYLAEGDLIIERGEFRSYGEMQRRYASLNEKGKPYWENARHAYRSDLPFNKVYDLSGGPNCFSQFEFIGGGSSNRWDGNAVRIPDYIFHSDEFLKWPFSYKEISPYYAAAEKMLNLCGDYSLLNPGSPATAINSADRYREPFQEIGLDMYLRNQAKNPVRGQGRQNRCMGAGSCEICPMDAKFRPEHIDINVPIQYETLGMSLVFDRGRAVALKGITPSGELLIEFERVVIAAHAVESAKLLYQSVLPKSVNLGSIGHYFQDHAQCDLRVLCPFEFPAGNLPFQASFEIQALTGIYENVDVRLGASGMRPALWEEGWVSLLQQQAGSFSEIKALMKRCAAMTLTYEMPPKRESYIDFSGQNPVARDPSWMDNVHRYNKILEIMLGKLEGYGFKILESRPHFRHTYGQHHLVGTLNMSAGEEAVVDRDFRVIGTDNVYVAGTALIPRLGAPNPTLTAVALSMMLGKQLELIN